MSGLRSRLDRIERETTPETGGIGRIIIRRCQEEHCPTAARNIAEGATEVAPGKYAAKCPRCGDEVLTLNLAERMQARLADTRSRGV